MFASVVIVVYMGGGRFSGDGTGKSVMARGGEPLREKRYQQMLCAPSYRKEIKDLGSEGEKGGNPINNVRAHPWLG